MNYSTFDTDGTAVVFCECRGVWAGAWRQVAPATWPVIEVRWLEDALGKLVATPWSVLILEGSTAPAPEMVALLVRIGADYPGVRVFVALAQGDLAWKQLWLEAGACDVLLTPRALARIVPQVERHFARAPRSPRALRDAVENLLPWPSAASAPRGDLLG